LTSEAFAERRAQIGAEVKPVVKQWWFWTGAGAVVVGAVVTAVALSAKGSTPAAPPSGTLDVDWK
jgi:hypothetical protein